MKYMIAPLAHSGKVSGLSYSVYDFTVVTILNPLVCICVWGHITLFICVVHDDAIGSTYNNIGMKVQLYMAMYNLPLALR